MSRIVTSFYNHDINFLRLVVRLLLTLDTFSGDNYDARQNRLQYFPGFQSIPHGHFMRSLRRLEYRLFKLLYADKDTDNSQIVFGTPSTDETRLLPWEKDAMRVLSGDKVRTPQKKLPMITKYFQGTIDFQDLNPGDQREVIGYWANLKLPVPRRVVFQDTSTSTPPEGHKGCEDAPNGGGSTQEGGEVENPPQPPFRDPVQQIRDDEIAYMQLEKRYREEKRLDSHFRG